MPGRILRAGVGFYCGFPHSFAVLLTRPGDLIKKPRCHMAKVERTWPAAPKNMLSTEITGNIIIENTIGRCSNRVRISRVSNFEFVISIVSTNINIHAFGWFKPF